MELRTLQADEREALLDLLDGWKLADGWRGRDFFRRHVELDPTYRDESVCVAVESGELLSCLQIFPRRLRVLGHAVPAGGIGSVFTRADARGRGIASQLLESAVGHMVERGMELSLLFGDEEIYARQGYRAWTATRIVLRRGGDPVPPSSAVEIVPFDWERDFAAVKAIHSAYSAPRSGTVVRDDTMWAASFRLAGNPAEEFRVARRAGKVVAYARATLMDEIFMVTELGRLDDADEELATLVVHMLLPRDGDPLAPPGKSSNELRSFALLPAFDDIPLALALEGRRVTTSPLEDRNSMLRCLDVNALARRLDISLLPDEDGDAFLQRIWPDDHFVFWPADRF